MSPSDDGGYVHDPARFDEGDDGDDGDDWIRSPVHPATADREFGRRGWILLAVVTFAFGIAPLSILLVPPGAEEYLFAMIALPLFPAIVLAVTAVWATTRP